MSDHWEGKLGKSEAARRAARAGQSKSDKSGVAMPFKAARLSDEQQALLARERLRVDAPPPRPARINPATGLPLIDISKAPSAMELRGAGRAREVV